MSAKEILMAAAGAYLPPPVFVSSSVNNSQTGTNTVTAPSGIQDGDLLIAVGFSNVTIGSLVPPAGFNAIYQERSTDNTSFIATKVASSESGNYAFSFPDPSVVAILVYRSANKVNTIGAIARTSTNAVTASSITPTYNGVLCAYFANEDDNVVVSSPPAGMGNRVSFVGGLSVKPGAFVIYDQQQTAASTGTKSVTLTGSANVSVGLLFQVTNEPIVAPEFVASANTQRGTSGTTLAINKPTGTVQNDLMIAVMTSDQGSGTWTPPAGWTEVADYGVTKPDFAVAYKVAGASEGSSYTFTDTSPGTLSGCILTYRYAAYDTISSFTDGTNPLVLPSITPSASQSVLIAAGARAAASITLGTPTSMTARVTDNDGTASSYIVCDQTVAKGPTGTRSMSTGSATTVAGIMLAIKPTRSL